MLDLQRTVCRVLDIDPADLARDAAAGDLDAMEVRRDRLLTWITCAVDELHEALDETNWKRHTRGDRWDAEMMFGELRDAMQFLVDLMFLATGLDATQLANKLFEAMEAKSEVNLARARNGDDGVARRCPSCKRSMDEPIAKGLARCRLGWCAVYGEYTIESVEGEVV
jgi:hypothetical protein